MSAHVRKGHDDGGDALPSRGWESEVFSMYRRLGAVGGLEQSQGSGMNVVLHLCILLCTVNANAAAVSHLTQSRKLQVCCYPMLTYEDWNHAHLGDLEILECPGFFRSPA